MEGMPRREALQMATGQERNAKNPAPWPGLLFTSILAEDVVVGGTGFEPVTPTMSR